MKSSFNTPGPKPGSHRAVKQHHAMAVGYELPACPRTVDTFQRESSSGCAYAPGLTGRKSKKKGK